MKFSGVTILQGVEFSIFSERELRYVRYMLSPFRLSVACLSVYLSVTLVRL